jgi:glutamate-5-semialdehyde dehydrogenase
MATTPVPELGRRAQAASRVLATAPGAAKDTALRLAADLLEQHGADILEANDQDLRRAQAEGATDTELDRLRLTEARIAAMAEGLRQVAVLPDPVGEVVEGTVRPNGLRVERVRVALGVIGIIYENRPNVTSDAAGLCLKAGNATMLRGSSSALRSNVAIVACLRLAAAKAGLPDDAVVLVEDTRREAAVEFMRLDGIIDCLIPRGGASLIATIREQATVPCVIDGDGNCHVYVDAAADLDTALSIVTNAKMQRPGVCNAAESLLVHQAVAGAFLPRVAGALAGVELVGDERARGFVPAMGVADDEDFATEFLDLKMSVAVVDSLEGAIDHIARYGTGHSEAIVTTDLLAADRFCREVDAGAVVVNASTRFVDGSELGLGAEIGISTQKLHARGPMGVRELTCTKYVVHGTGQVRG